MNFEVISCSDNLNLLRVRLTRFDVLVSFNPKYTGTKCHACAIHCSRRGLDTTGRCLAAACFSLCLMWAFIPRTADNSKSHWQALSSERCSGGKPARALLITWDYRRRTAAVLMQNCCSNQNVCLSRGKIKINIGCNDDSLIIQRVTDYQTWRSFLLCNGEVLFFAVWKVTCWYVARVHNLKQLLSPML